MNPRNKIVQIIFLILCSASGNSIAQSQIINKDLDVKGIVDVINKVVDQNKLLPDKQDSANQEVQKDSPAKQQPTPLKNSPANNSKSDNLSLMYSDEEIKKIQEALDALREGRPLLSNNQLASNEDKTTITTPEDNAKSYIYLGSILYNSPNNWSVWINDQKISAANNQIGNELYIKSINEDEVRILWTMSIIKWKILTNKKSEEGAPINQNNQVEFDFTLSFNQTYMLNGGKTAEGRVAPLLTSSSFKIPDSKNTSNLTSKQ